MTWTCLQVGGVRSANGGGEETERGLGVLLLLGAGGERRECSRMEGGGGFHSLEERGRAGWGIKW